MAILNYILVTNAFVHLEEQRNEIRVILGGYVPRQHIRRAVFMHYLWGWAFAIFRLDLETTCPYNPFLLVVHCLNLVSLL